MRDQILALVAAVRETREAAALCCNHKGVALSGLDGTAKPVFLAALRSLVETAGTLVFVVSGRDAVREYRQALSWLYPDLPMQELYPVNLPRVQAETQNLEVQAGRAAALRLIHNEEAGIVFVTAEAWMQRLPNPEGFAKGTLEIAKGKDFDQSGLIEKLTEIGYERTDEVDAIGQFCVRGGIMDIFPLNSDRPVRLEWFDETVDDVRPYDLDTKRSVGTVESVRVLPLRKVGGDEGYGSNLFEYGTKDTLFVLDEPALLLETVEHLYKEAADFRGDVWRPEELERQAEAAQVLAVSALEGNKFPSYSHLQVPVRRASSYNRSINLLVEDLGNLTADGVTPYIMMTTALKARSIAENLRENGVPALCLNDEPGERGKANCGAGELFNGFRFWNEDWVLLTENDIYGLQRRHRFKSKHKGAQLQYFTDIKGGDYVVHDVHGIGRYIGVENVEVDGLHRDYLLIQYAGTDRLYVPVDQVGLLHKYVGAEGVTPKLSKMGGAEWRRMKSRASTAITALAEELLRLYAQRRITKGFAFSPDTEFQKEFEEKFPYEETPDQLKAIAEIKADMEKPVPMDRLLCGDVGYGKTEVALRAAFKAVMDGKQVAVLVPTTVLAQQHLLTFHERLDPFGLRVAMISRFVAGKEMDDVLRRLAEGNVDIIIGTHRLLQSDVVFHDLGLLIIDEEQRFGVQHKEQLKNMREQVDVLTLSATPIPRTMQMAVSGVRDMSLIMTAPPGRLPVKVTVGEWDPDVVSAAIRFELARKGQVYYVSNRVKTIDDAVMRVQEAAPEARIGVAHGKMSPREVEDMMMKFQEHEIDVLVATTIIESGIDNPHTNTLIIEDSQRLGLAQLYQLKGRVGRGRIQAYAYFMFPGEQPLTPEATDRLTAINEYQDLGSGMRIAMRDLEIRGAGSLVGAEQHGNLSSVGFDLFTQMLGEAVSEARGETAQTEQPEVTINLSADFYLAEEYLPEVDKRVLVYRQLASASELSDVDRIQKDCEERYGALPLAGRNLFDRARIRIRCQRMGVTSVSLIQGRFVYQGIEVPRKLALKFKERHAFYYPKTKQLKYPFHKGAEEIVPAALGILEEVGGDDEEDE